MGNILSTKYDKLEILSKELSLLYTKKSTTYNSPNQLFKLVENSIDGQFFDPPKDYRHFIVSRVIPHFITDKKMMEYIYDSIQPVIVSDIDKVLLQLLTINFKHIIVLNMIIIKKYRSYNYYIPQNGLDLVNIDLAHHLHILLYMYPSAKPSISGSTAYKYQCGYYDPYDSKFPGFSYCNKRIFI